MTILSGSYVGTGRRLFGLALRTMFLTIITLGIYRFWMKARIRQYYFASTRIEKEPLEYTGTGLEKLLGFLVAVVFLAIYLGVLQVVLSFIGLAYLEGGQLALNLPLLALIPLYFFAFYRARRYVLSRTKFRGLRFGLEPAARTYMVYALGQFALTVLTLGVLYPRQKFNLERFMTERLAFGTARFRQGGTWTMLMRPWLGVLGLVWLAVAFYAYAFVPMMTSETPKPADVVRFGYFALAGMVALAMAYVMYLRFQAIAFRKLTNAKGAGEAISFESTVSVWRVLMIYILGGLTVAVLGGLLIGLLGAMIFVTMVGGGMPVVDLSISEVSKALADQQYVALALSMLAYMTFFLVLSALTHVFITQKIWLEYIQTLTITDPGEIGAIRQRAHDTAAEAEGFADALDVGAAI